MPQLIRINVDGPDELLTLYGAGAVIRVETSASGTGSWSELTTEPIVAGVSQYVIESLTATGYERHRYSTSTGASPSAYSPVVQFGALSAYATLADLEETLSLGGDTTRRNLLSDMLEDVSADVDAMCHRRFYRDPQVSGDITVYCDVTHAGHASLLSAIGHPYTVDSRALDIISITTISARDSETGSYTSCGTVDVDWFLDTEDAAMGPDWPYGDVSLSPSGTVRTTWPTGKRAVKLVGALGFATVPKVVKRAVVSEVRERFRQSIGGGPTQVGVNTFGTPIFITGDSPDMRRLAKPPYALHRYRSV